MVAPNTQVSPLKHHLKGSNTLTSFRNYSRIQSEVQREGSEVHKENLSSLLLSRNSNHFRAGEKAEAIAPSGSQVGHLHVQKASAKTELPSVPPVENVTSSHVHNVQEHEHDIHHKDLRISHGIKCLFAPTTVENPSSKATLSGSAALQSLIPGEEAINAYNLYAEMFPPMNTCTPTSDMHKEQEFCSFKPTHIAERVEVVQFLPDIKAVEADHEGNEKRLKYTLNIEDHMQTSQQGNPSCSVVDGSTMSAARDGARQASTWNVCSTKCVCKSNICTVSKPTPRLTGNVCSTKCVCKSNNCAVSKPTPQHSPNDCNVGFQSNMSWASSVNAYSACGTSLTAELANASPAIGLKLFTTSAYAQMPKALLTFSEGEPSLPLSLERSDQQASNRLQKTPMHEDYCTDADWGRFLALSATPVADYMEIASARVLPFQQRFKQLQAFLKQCDETDQDEGVQALRSLSAAARSGYAVELETRAIRLSLEEGKEIKRMRSLNVLGKISERSIDDAGATPNGPRLPAPGATATLNSVT